MRRLYCVLCLWVGVLFATEARAAVPLVDGSAPRRALVAVDLTGAPSSTLSPELEYAVSARVSLVLQLDVGWTRWSDSGPGTGSMHALSLGGELGVNGFLSGAAPSGLWMGLRFGGSRYSLTDAAGRSVFHDEQGSMLLGYTRILESGIALQVAAGPELSHGGGSIPGQSGNVAQSWSANLRVLAAVGFAF